MSYFELWLCAVTAAAFSALFGVSADTCLAVIYFTGVAYATAAMFHKDPEVRE